MLEPLTMTADVAETPLAAVAVMLAEPAFFAVSPPANPADVTRTTLFVYAGLLVDVPVIIPAFEYTGTVILYGRLPPVGTATS